jgi:hypothetical protein
VFCVLSFVVSFLVFFEVFNGVLILICVVGV